MENIRYLVYKFIHEKGWERGVYESRAVDYYNQMRQGTMKYSQAYKVSNAQLYIWVKSSVVANEISLDNTRILQELNNRLGERLIDGFRFQASDCDWPEDLDSPEKPPLSQVEKADIETLVNTIDHTEIRHLLKQIFTGALSLEKLGRIKSKAKERI